MLRQALRELRYHPSRFVATVLAIAISVAFMAGSSVIVATEQNGLERQQSLPIAGADAVVTLESWEGDTPPDLRDTLAGVPQVAAAEASLTTSDGLTHDRNTVLVNLIGLPSEPFRWSHLVDGRWPERADEITLSRGAAGALKAAIGDTIASGLDDLGYTVVGLTGEPNSLFVQTGYLAREAFDRYHVDPDTGSGTWLVRGTPGVGLDQLVGAVKPVVPPGATVQSAAEIRAKAVEDLTDGFQAFRNLLWVFAAIAAVVGMITIANTFTILLAQRRRQIGLLRAVGAAASQVRNRYLAEAIALGVIGAGLGILLGIGLAAIGAAITGSLYWGLALPASELAVAFAAGLLITVVAAYFPVLRGTRVRPLEALQPELSSDERRRAGWVRGVVCGVLVAGGLAVALGSLTQDDPLLLAIAGSALLALGVLFGAPLFVPRLLRGLGSLVAPLGVTPRLAAQNSVRNPRRAAATATALMLAVGLIVTLQVGTASVRASLLSEIDQRRPVDAAVHAWGLEAAVPADLRAQLAQVPGVDGVASLSVGTADFTRASERYEGLMVIGFDPAIVQVAVGAPASLGDDQILVSSRAEAAEDGQRVTLSTTQGSVDLTLTRSRLLEVGQVMVSAATLQKLGGALPDALVWLSIPDRSQAISAVGQILDLAGDQFAVTGGVVEAAQIEQVLDLLLLITTALLAVAVLIALVGVSNTLGLSVIERTRESALLRALGLQTRSLRVMLLIEALLLAGVGVLVGIAAGVFFGWLGATALTATVDGAQHRLAIDLPQTLGMLVIAVVAAALASVLPGRRAATASPTEALADV
ncbi:MAG: FtsX-like permease family protein [Propionicimonas sp.]|uniref:ABC transporter permease n=1 Tax=Propionicimonas sp. TaxID=1955623 RepID=UPI002B1FA346|nr:FtsX-like permease family protein [Propionicimonas sp.]MEA4945566.1 FtsX-like permease family protein [Propionicimonas sp.]